MKTLTALAAGSYRFGSTGGRLGPVNPLPAPTEPRAAFTSPLLPAVIAADYGANPTSREKNLGNVRFTTMEVEELLSASPAPEVEVVPYLQEAAAPQE